MPADVVAVIRFGPVAHDVTQARAAGANCGYHARRRCVTWQCREFFNGLATCDPLCLYGAWRGRNAGRCRTACRGTGSRPGVDSGVSDPAGMFLREMQEDALSPVAGERSAFLQHVVRIGPAVPTPVLAQGWIVTLWGGFAMMPKPAPVSVALHGAQSQAAPACDGFRSLARRLLATRGERHQVKAGGSSEPVCG